MINLSKFPAGMLMFFFITCANAGEALIFNDSGLTGYKEAGSIAGIYSSVSTRFSCLFIFFQREPQFYSVNKDGFSNTKIMTFTPGDGLLVFEDRDKKFDIFGNLYRRDERWIIRTSRAQAGCENSAGAFTFDLGDPSARVYRVVQKIPAIGIRLVKNKTYFCDYRNGKYVARKGYLTRWDSVILLKVKDRFSYVRFMDPRFDLESSGKVTTGWVRSSDLANPLPSLK